MPQYTKDIRRLTRAEALLAIAHAQLEAARVELAAAHRNAPLSQKDKKEIEVAEGKAARAQLSINEARQIIDLHLPSPE